MPTRALQAGWLLTLMSMLPLLGWVVLGAVEEQQGGQEGPCACKTR